jgi:hypothetical protein
MLLFLAPLAAGIVAGYAFGGRLHQLAKTRIRAAWLLWLAAALQFVHFRVTSLRVEVESRTGVSLMVPIFGLVFAWVLVNLPDRPRPVRIAAMVVLLGGAMNAAVIAANGRMPYSESAARAAHQTPKHVVMDSTTRLAWLGDVIPVPPVQKVISAGDVVLLLGAAGLIATSMQARPTSAARTGVRAGKG